MAQCEQTTLYVTVDKEETSTYLDFAAMMTAANRKQYHQVARDGTPKCYRVMVTACKGNTDLHHIQNSFITCNAVKQVTAGWKAQLRHAGVKLRNLSPYGRRPRFGLETGAIFLNHNIGVPGEDIWEISNDHLGAQMDLAVADSFFSSYTATDDTAVTYKSLPLAVANSIAANQITQVTITDGAGTEKNEPLVLSGAGVLNEFNVLFEYMNARRGTPDFSIDTPGPSDDSPMLNLFSVSEEMSDDIVDGIEDYMDWKPYTPDHSTNVYDELTLGCQVDAGTSATSQYPPVSAVVDIPLGLAKLDGADTTIFRFDVLAIYEM